MTKIGARNLWFQVHKWIGLILAILIIPISVTGSALVWHDALDRMVNPVRNAVSGHSLLAPDRYIAAARARLQPGERIAQLTLPDGHGGPVVVAAARAGQGKPPPGPPARTLVYLDPPTATVLEVGNSRAGLVRVLHGLHGSLLVPGIGRQIVGWIGVAMLFSAFTGLWLWWPTVGRWVRGLRWRRHRNLDTNLHHLLGFWIAVPLFVLSLTGAWISFPQFFGAIVGQGQARPGGGMDRATMARARPIERPATPIESVLARAATLARGDLRAITWPTDKRADWSVAYTSEAGLPVTVTVADDSGTAALAPPRGNGGVARLMRQIHDGTDMGLVWQMIIFAGGILPAILAVTGIIMWWRARGWRGDVKRRRASRRGRAVAAE